MVFFVHSTRELWRDDYRAFELSVAHIVHRLLFAVVIHRDEGANVGAYGVERLANPQRLRASVLVNNGEPGVANLSAERVAQDDELHQRKDHGRQHQRRRTKELAHFALDNSHHSVHRIQPERFINSIPSFTVATPAAAAW